MTDRMGSAASSTRLVLERLAACLNNPAVIIPSLLVLFTRSRVVGVERPGTGRAVEVVVGLGTTGLPVLVERLNAVLLLLLLLLGVAPRGKLIALSDGRTTGEGGPTWRNDLRLNDESVLMGVGVGTSLADLVRQPKSPERDDEPSFLSFPLAISGDWCGWACGLGGLARSRSSGTLCARGGGGTRGSSSESEQCKFGLLWFVGVPVCVCIIVMACIGVCRSMSMSWGRVLSGSIPAVGRTRARECAW
ncbi:hypothetical protein AG1IA_05710 [Rhizoctonia solani AG-1 IA]|uniref:Uncharacterized protein n=1 Tax=Thanatephorus cucumeris (strain AG1-IA) TaxID=983506 RepID=L8WQI5_THACA|nr:hypothetical protein AG1IA_05710 [Rhizoctonia solani AG-1 IA]